VLALAREEDSQQGPEQPPAPEDGKSSGNRSKMIDLPGQRVKRSMGRLVFTSAAPDPARAGRRRGRPRPRL